MALAAAMLWHGALWAGPLDGRTYRGEITDEKGAVMGPDTVTFEKGLFRSQTCADLGITASPYWVRSEGPTTHYLVEAGNAQTGRMVFRGFVRGDHVEWQGVWTKERWYWTVRRELRFKSVAAK